MQISEGYRVFRIISGIGATPHVAGVAPFVTRPFP
jgi:hypothetical protein